MSCGRSGGIRRWIAVLDERELQRVKALVLGSSQDPLEALLTLYDDAHHQEHEQPSEASPVSALTMLSSTSGIDYLLGQAREQPRLAIEEPKSILRDLGIDVDEAVRRGRRGKADGYHK